MARYERDWRPSAPEYDRAYRGGYRRGFARGYGGYDVRSDYGLSNIPAHGPAWEQDRRPIFGRDRRITSARGYPYDRGYRGGRAPGADFRPLRPQDPLAREIRDEAADLVADYLLDEGPEGMRYLASEPRAGRRRGG